MSQRSLFAKPNHPTLALNYGMNAPPRPMEPGAGSGSISLATSPGFSDFGDSQTIGHLTRSSSNSSGAFTRPAAQQQTPLAEWYTSPAAPWDPMNGRARSDLRVGGKPNYRSSGVSFSGYRSPYNSPSDCETTAPGHLPSDSGYGSLTRQSVVADGSLYGDCDRSGDTASVSSHLAGIHFDRPVLCTPQDWRPQPAVHNETLVSTDSNRLVCPHCKEKVKTKSELKKHEQRHTKPFFCKALDCSRHGQGFSTPNDVERHMRSCHPEMSTKGKIYKCTIANCRSKDKKWPRADNFRQHLKRVHRIQHVDDNLDKYVYTLQASAGSDLAGLGTSVGAGLVSLDINPDRLNSTPWELSTQPTPEQIPRDPCELNDFINQQMDFQRRTLMAQEHIAMMSHVGHHVPDDIMQVPSLELDQESSLTPLEPIHPQSQRLQNFTASSVDDHETDYEEPSFFNEASISDHESQEDERSIMHNVSDLDMDTAEDVCEDRRAVEEPSRGIVAESPTDSAHHAATQEAITLHNDDTSTMSTSPAPSSSINDETTQPSLDATVCLEMQVKESRLDVSDVVQDQDKAYDFIKALKERGLLAGLLEKVEYEKPKDGEVQSQADISTQPDMGKNLHSCPRPDCSKSFPRQCELRKHMKRHAKPYGCTFPQCAKRFGSKNDWKRHENSQHYQLELWKCNEKSKLDTDDLCNRPYSRREQFKIHLSRDHGITDPAHVDQKLEECLDGRNYEVRFWCGFCKTMVKVKETGMKAWIGRFNHIDSHFSGQMDISEWRSPDPGLPDVDVLPTGSSEGSHGGFQNIAAFLPAGAESVRRLSKRGADEEAPQSRPPKKARPSAVWYCCGCGNQSLTSFTAVCLSPGCMGHEQCVDCRLDVIPNDNFENDG